MKRWLLIIGSILLALALIAGGVIYSWTFTPQGRLDVDVAILLKLSPEYPAPGTVSIDEERRFLRDGALRMAIDVPLEEVVDRKIPGPDGDIPVRIYRPTNQPDLPILVYYHGGAWRLGDLDTHDTLCRQLAKRADTIVVSVDYRLAPENPFPAAVTDSYAALLWAAEHAAALGGDGGRLAVGGDSAGGNLAAAVTLKSRDLAGPKILFQLLIYPATNLADFNTSSHADFKEGFLLTRELMEYSRDAYIPDMSTRRNPYASPLLAEDHRNLPPALIITAGFDPLRDEGEAYAEKLQGAGVDARVSRYEGVTHAFVALPFIRKSEQAIGEAADALKEAFLGKN